MNECLRYQEMISALIDGEISGEEHSALLNHIDSCRRCGEMYAVFSAISDVAAGDIGELPAGLHENIMAGVRRASIEKNNRRHGSRHFKSIIAAAACFAVVMFAVGGAVTELSRRAAVKNETGALESAEMTVVTDAIATMDVQAAGVANAAVYAQSNMSVPSPSPTAAAPADGVDVYAAGMTTEPAASADPYLSRQAATPAKPAAETPAENAPAYEILPGITGEAAAESFAVPELLPECAGDAATESFAAPGLLPGNSAAAPVSTPSRISEAVAPDTLEYKLELKDKLSWKELSAVLLPSLTKETKTAELPEAYCDALYTLTLPLKDAAAAGTAAEGTAVTEEILVFRYGESLYVSLPKTHEISGIYLSPCTLADYEELIAPFLSSAVSADH